MSLLRQLILAITFLVMLLLAGNLVVSVVNARTYFYEQLKVQAQDTATALGFSISSAAQEKDLALVGSMLDVIFDRGYYRAISYRDLSGQPLLVRELDRAHGEVPDWFVALIRIPEPEGSAEVVSGWYRLGSIRVVAYTGLAYRDLWRVFREQFGVFLFTAVLAYGLAGVGLHFLLAPLRRMERQAEAICRRELPEPQDLPRTPELRAMALAMNKMVAKIRDIFAEQLELTESLHRASHLDPVTGLSSRQHFDARLEAFIQSEQGGGEAALLLLQLAELAEYNQAHGREAGDQLLRALSALLAPLARRYPGAIVSRRSGADFCVFVPGIDRLQTEQLCIELMAQAGQIGWPGGRLPLFLGAVHEPSTTLDSQLLARADEALARARHQGGEGWWLAEARATSSRPAGQWRNLLKAVVQQGQLQLHCQPVYDIAGALLQVELLVRLSVDGELRSAGSVLPLIERFGLAQQLDRQVLSRLPDTPLPGQWPVCVNLSPRSLLAPDFIPWLRSFLTAQPALARRLVLELSEPDNLGQTEALAQLCAQTADLGVRVSLDHFGLAGRAFNYLQGLQLYSLKIDRSFIGRLDARQDNQFFVRSLAQIAHSCDIMLLAEGVETEAEWQAVKALGVDGGLGYHLGRPGPHWPDLPDANR